MGPRSSVEEQSTQTSRAGPPLGVSIGGDARLPGWDSFPRSTRRLALELIVQTACRQVRGRPPSRLGGERG
jgi:hypothetical protein